MSDILTHEDYIAAAPEHLRASLEFLRKELSRALPDSEAIIAYKMPGFRIGTAIVAGYAAFSKQCGLYVQNEAIHACADDIAAEGLKATKTGVTFSPDKPITATLVSKLALASRKYNQAAK